MNNVSLFSIGYSGFFENITGFVETLMNKGINVVIDVRSNPYSSVYQEYNKENLENTLKRFGIYYRNYAAEFGAHQEDRTLYPNGYLDFKKFSKTNAFRSGVEKIEKSVEQGYRVAFMCAEKEPKTCHRAILVTKAFSDLGYEINHILPDGSIKTQHDVENEIAIDNPPSFFDNLDEDAIAFAYMKQNEKIGYRPEAQK